MKIVLSFLLSFSTIMLPGIGMADGFYTWWNKLNYTQKVIFLTGYQEGISALCSPLSKEIADKKIQKKYKLNNDDVDTFQHIDGYEEIKQDAYETCSIFWGFSEKTDISKAIRALDYAYKRHSKDTPTAIIVMCSRIDEYKECIDGRTKK